MAKSLPGKGWCRVHWRDCAYSVGHGEDGMVVCLMGKCPMEGGK